MNKQVNSELIILAREAAGITQKELADRVGISQANISRIENGFIAITDEMIQKIADTLSFPVNFFYEDGKINSVKNYHFRKAKSLPTKEFIRLNAESIVDKLRIEKLLRPVEIETEYVSLELAEFEKPENIAKELRKLWKVSKGPIPNLTALLESKGIMIMPVDFGTRLISDMTTQTEKGIFIIFLNSIMPPDRKRFTLAHALGHIIMHDFATTTVIEDEADRFAGEFLMPTEEIYYQLTDLNLSRLADLKRYWKVSMAAVLMKAGQLEVISDNQKQYLWRKISARGYRLKEPEDITIKDEEATLLNDIIEIHKKELQYSTEDLADLLFLRENEYQKYGLEKKSNIRLVHLDNRLREK